MLVRLVSLDDGASPIDITKELVVVGRKEDCDIQLDHKSVSKLHCVLVRTEGLLLLRDLGSTNGTRVNGQRIRRAALLANDLLNIASLRFKVHFMQEEEPAEQDGYTQQMDAKEVAKVLGQTVGRDSDSDSDVEDGPAIRANVLPDHYEDPPKK